MRNVRDSFQDVAVVSERLTTKVNPIVIAPEGSIAYTKAANTLLASNGLRWTAVGSSMPGAVLVFRPGYTGTEYDNVYGVWSDLYAKIITIQGPKSIFMDDSLLPFGDPIIIPPGIWDMSGVTWFVGLCGVHTPPVLFTQINISDGATINNICCFSGPMIVTFQGTGTEAAVTLNTLPNSRNASIHLAYGAQLSTSGTQPFLRIQEGFGEMITNYASIIYGTTSMTPASCPVLDAAAGCQLIIVLGSDCTLEDNSVSGAGFTLCIRLIPGAIASVPPVQTLAIGGFFMSSVYTSPDTYQRAVPPVVTDDDTIGYKIGDLWIDTVATKFYVAISVSTGAAIWNGPY